jgi:hypothetical protein
MPAGLLVGEIEGKVIEKLNNEVCILVDGNEDDIEYVSDWIVNNCPQPGTYVRIIVMSFPEKGE